MKFKKLHEIIRSYMKFAVTEVIKCFQISG